MLGFRDYSIKKKLTAMTLLASGTALLLACVAFLTYEWITFRGTMVRSLSTQADIVGYNSASALLFQDPHSAEATLAALQAKPQILAAGIYGRDGQPFARYQRNGVKKTLPLPTLPGGESARHWFADRQLVVIRPIVYEGERLGTVYIQSDLHEMDARLKSYAGIVAVALPVFLLVSFVIGSRLQPLIAQPVLLLAETAGRVSREKNYSVRVPPGNRDELGLLMAAFNEMLAGIEERDAALEKAHNELEKRVLERTAELAAANKELEAFTYSVSHDLRAPLRQVDGFAQLLLEEHSGELSAEAREHLSQVREGTRLMGQLVDDLLSLTRVGRQELRRQVTGLNSLVGEVVEELRPELEGRQVEWRLGELPFVDCDPRLMKQVFANLLSNAVKYTRPRIRAVIEVGQTQANGEPVIFVRDNGVGFSMKYADKLFGVFQRLHRQEDFEGTGVGLATAQRILHKHGGRIWAEAELDRGATFYVALPATEPTGSEPVVGGGKP